MGRHKSRRGVGGHREALTIILSIIADPTVKCPPPAFAVQQSGWGTVSTIKRKHREYHLQKRLAKQTNPKSFMDNGPCEPLRDQNVAKSRTSS